MRVEPYGVGSVVHVVKRGARGAPIVRDEADRMRFVRSLFLLNDHHQTANRGETEVHKSDLCSRPETWPARRPLVSVLAWTLMPNHFHLLLCEATEGGIAKFMQRLGGSMSVAFNQKYTESGSLFQGSYKSRTVDDDAYLRYVFAYITVKNVLELAPGGIAAAIENYEKTWAWACAYQYTSLGEHMSGRISAILDEEKLHELDLPGQNFKSEAQNMLIGHTALHEEYQRLQLEEW